MATPLSNAFDALDSGVDQWKFALQHKGKASILLDNDATIISFGEIGKDGHPHNCHFKDFIGYDQGAIDLLQALGFDAESV